MKEEILQKIKEIEEKLKSEGKLEENDYTFLFGLSLLRDKENGDKR